MVYGFRHLCIYFVLKLGEILCISSICYYIIKSSKGIFNGI